MQKNIQTILRIIQEKIALNRKEDFNEYSDPYFLLGEITKEVEEAKAELKEDNSVYLEDELGDILWDYLYVLATLENSGNINIDSVISRCEKKYSERLEGIKSGKTWKEVKTMQKEELKKEHEKKYGVLSAGDPFQDQTTQIYDTGAQIFKERTQDLEDFGGMFAAFEQYVQRGKILDVGCAYGRHISGLLKLGYDACGIELSSELISLAEPQVQDRITHRSMLDITQIYSKESFDGIISSASIVHMDKQFGIKVLEDIFSLLRRKGYFYLSFLVKDENMISDTKIKPSKTIPTDKKYVYYTEEEMTSILAKIGFESKKEFVNSPHNDTWKTIIAQKI